MKSEIPLEHPILGAAEARAEEANAFASGLADERVVLENAGRAVALAVAARFPDGRVVGAVGPGNNGRDTLVALRTLKSWGREVAAIAAAPSAEHGDVLHGWDVEWDGSPAALPRAGVLLDGLLGTGASGPPRQQMHEIIAALNGSSVPTVAVDGPSGVDLTTGVAGEIAVRAELTVTFGALKRGLVLHPGRAFAGRILVAEIGLPPASEAISAVPRVITEEWAHGNLPFIAPDAYKTKVGLVVVVAGRAGMGGAAIMTGMGALRAGAGGIRIVSSADNRSAIHSAIPEAVFFDREGEATASALIDAAAVVVGPGIGADDEGAALLKRLFDDFSGPLVVDADAITILSRSPELQERVRDRSVILTPHPGELGRLLGTHTSKVLSSRFEAAAEASAKYGCTVLSKGAPSIVAAPDLPPLVGFSGHSGVATAGMGDTLAGIVGAFAAAGAPPRTAAALGLHFAGRAADVAGKGRGLLPRDVAEALPLALKRSTPTRISPPFLLELAPAV